MIRIDDLLLSERPTLIVTHRKPDGDAVGASMGLAAVLRANRRGAEVLMPDGTKAVRDIVDIGATLDERIADGFYFARSLKLIKHIFANPALLEKPIGEDSGFFEKV